MSAPIPPTLKHLLHTLSSDDMYVYTGGFLAGLKSVRQGLELLPSQILEQIPNWINYSVHCVIGGVISLTIKKVFDKLFNKGNNDNNRQSGTN